MNRSAIANWLLEEFSGRFKEKASEGLTTLIWFDSNRYWLPAIPGLIESADQWHLTVNNDDMAPMMLIAVGPDIDQRSGKSPLEIRQLILSDRTLHSNPSGLKAWDKLTRWIIYCPYPVEWLDEASRPKKSYPLSWLRPFSEAGLEWGRKGGDEEKLPAFLRSRGLRITNDKKQLEDLYHISKTDRSASPLARLVARNLEKPREFWLEKTWDRNTVRNELTGNVGRLMEELLISPEMTVKRLRETDILQDFLLQLESYLGFSGKAEEMISNTEDFNRQLIKHLAFCTTWKLTGYDQASPFASPSLPNYKVDHCHEAIASMLKIQETGEVYVRQCQTLEKEGLNLIGNVDINTYGHVFPHLIIGRWLEEKKILEEAAGASLKNIRKSIQAARVDNYDHTWDKLMPGELGWQWLSCLKEMEARIATGEAYLVANQEEDLEALIDQYADTQRGWWKIDEIYRKLLTLAIDDPHGDLIRALAMPLYNAWIANVGGQFSELLTKTQDFQSLDKITPVTKGSFSLWSLPEGREKKAVLLIDALRFDLAMQIKADLEKDGFKVNVQPWMAGLPSKTEVGMSLLLSGAEIKLEVKDKKVSVSCKGRDLANKNSRIESLKERLGQEVAALELKNLTKSSLKTVKAKILAVFSREIDAEGEAKGLGLVKDIEKEMAELVRKVKILAQSGYSEIQMATDHGFLLSSDVGIVKWKAPEGAEVCDRRFALIPKKIGTDHPAINCPWDNNYWLVLPPAGTVFECPGKTEYLHRGASLQELIIPYVRIRVQKQVVRAILVMIIDQNVVDSGVVKVILKGSNPKDQLSLLAQPAVVLPRSGNIVAELKGRSFSMPKSFELGAGDQLQLNLFLERGLKTGDEVEIAARDGEEILDKKILKVTCDV